MIINFKVIPFHPFTAGITEFLKIGMVCFGLEKQWGIWVTSQGWYAL